jgi:hypothetical protein
MLGGGAAYEGLAPVIGPRARLPSEGWRNVKGSVARDLAGGGLLTIPPALGFLRSIRKDFDRIVVIGDMVVPYLALAAGLGDILYLDVYKTGFGRPYSAIDKAVLKRVAGTVFCRHDTLSQSLVAAGINGRYAGNLMMDTIPRTGLVLERRKPLAVAVLPGSRAHAIDNFAIQSAAVDFLTDKPDVFVPVARGLDLPARKDMTFVRGTSLGDVLDIADVVLSQAGTATVQAAGLGKPVITFRNAHDRASRFEAEQRMFDEARQIVLAQPAAIAEKLESLLRDPAERVRLGVIGRSRVGQAGALPAIIAAI